LLENFNNSKKKLNDDERSKFRKFIKFCASKHLLEEAEFSFEAIKRKQSIEQIAFFHFEKEFKKEFKDLDGTIIFNSPNYKVWIGNFKTRIEVERAMVDIKKKYPTALIIKPSN